MPVTIGVAAPSTAATVGWTKHALDSGATAVMALPLINYNPTRREVVTYYQTISEVGLPIAAYNNPYYAATDLTPEFLAELSKIENFVAVKDFSGDVRRIAGIRELCDLEILAGVDDLALEGFLAGATGCIAGFATRGVALSTIANGLEQRSEEFAQLAVREVGKPLVESRGEITRAVSILRYYAQMVLAPDGETYPASQAKDWLIARRYPVGVCALITPWNFPVAIPLWKAAPALGYGNAVLLKPAPPATAIAENLAELVGEHLPEGVFQVVPG